MGGMERRELMKATALGGVALSIGGDQSLLAANEARAHGTSSRPGGWPNRRLLDLMKIDHPIIQAPMGGGHISLDMPVAAAGRAGSALFLVPR